jgi:hypothetical protein
MNIWPGTLSSGARHTERHHCGELILELDSCFCTTIMIETIILSAMFSQNEESS